MAEKEICPGLQKKCIEEIFADVIIQNRKHRRKKRRKLIGKLIFWTFVTVLEINAFKDLLEFIFNNQNFQL